MVEVAFDVFVVAVDSHHCFPFQNIFAFKKSTGRRGSFGISAFGFLSVGVFTFPWKSVS